MKVLDDNVSAIIIGRIFFPVLYTLLISRGAILNIKFMTSFAERYKWVNKHGRHRTSRLFMQRGNS